MKTLKLTAAFALTLMSLNTFAQTVRSSDENGNEINDPNLNSVSPHCCAGKIAGSNVVGFSPFHFSENGIGLSLSWEKLLDKDGILSFQLPFSATFNMNNSDALGRQTNEDPMFYVYPGIKIYPKSAFGKVKYAIGPSLVLGAGQKTQTNYGNYPYSNYTEETVSKTVFGILVNNSLNITPSPKTYIGIEFGLGFTYLNYEGGDRKPMQTLVQGGFKFGYRF